MKNQVYTESDLKLLNSNKALKYMLETKGEVDPMKALRYVRAESELERLQVQLIKLQRWVIENKKRICILFEGRDAAGKGGAIRRITHHLNPRHYKVIALPKPTEIERGQWYFQRYIQNLPNPGEITLFDRSWYNRAVVEPVNGFCTEEEYERFMNEVNHFEHMITSDGIILIKFYISISKNEQKKRFEEISNNPLKRWKMTPVDEHAQELWKQYTSFKDRMFEHTNTKSNPWVIIEADRKIAARIKVIKYILKTVPFKKKRKSKVEEIVPDPRDLGSNS
ncbi:MAG: polyphosphate kinase 2 [Cyclobacteriaceae bacterium]|nr:polyphosphate kinase 2 [Cyclobacteriaceae bacterium]